MEIEKNNVDQFMDELGVKVDEEDNQGEYVPTTDDFLIIEYFENGENAGKIKSSKVDIDKVADCIISTHNIKTWFGKKNDYSYNFNGKIFEQNSRGIVKVECQNLLKKYCRRNIAIEIFEKVKAKTEIKRDQFEKTDNNFICFENGVWDVKGKELMPHDPKYNFQTLIPQTYNKNAQCPSWERFISETLYPDDVLVMQEWFGFNLFREYFLKKAIICVGSQNTGKSVVLDTAIKFIGEKNKTGLSLQKMTSGSDFTKLSLKNKHSNIYDDLSSNDLNDGGAFKVATGGGYISGEEKFGEYQQFRSFAKQMFATNKIPPVKDNDDLAYFGRWIVFKFDNIPEKLDPFLREKLWAGEEMSGILNWALEGLYRLLENGEFSYNKNSDEIKQIMEESGCPLVAFQSDVLEKENGYTITKEEMFNVYSLWCEEKKKPRLTKEMLGRQLPKYCQYINSVKQKERVWQNARLNSSWLEKLKNSVVSGDNINNTDTTDTFHKNMRNISKGNNKDINMIYIKSEKVSDVPIKSQEIDIEKSGIKEILEDHKNE